MSLLGDIDKLASHVQQLKSAVQEKTQTDAQVEELNNLINSQREALRNIHTSAKRGMNGVDRTQQFDYILRVCAEMGVSSLSVKDN